jgi:hypothetical protein
MSGDSYVGMFNGWLGLVRLQWRFLGDQPETREYDARRGMAFTRAR